MSHSIEQITDLSLEAQSRELALLEQAQAAIEEATTVKSAKEIRDRAEALEVYAKRVEYGGILQKRCTEIKLRAERKAGELLREVVRRGGDRRSKVTPDDHAPPTLTDLGVSKNESAKWQRIASMPETEFEEAVSEANSETELLRKAKALEQQAEVAENERKVAEAPSLDAAVLEGGIFSTIVIDPPWDAGDEGDVNQFGRTQPTYATMPFEVVKDLEVPHLSADDCHLYLWITNRSLPKGFQLLEAWGFRYVTMLTWCKPSIGVGNYYRNNTEQILFGVKGSLGILRHDVGTWFEAPRGDRHSAKPDEFYDMVDTCSPGPKLDMFARRTRPGWYTWGENGVQAPGE
jgi:N6-adenosine-specific RNA methylase IME4